MPPPNKSTVLFTGTTGLDTSVILQSLANYFCQVNELPVHDSVIQWVSLEERLVREISASWPAFIQTYSANTRQEDWENATGNIVSARGNTDHLYVSMHLTYCVRGEFVSLIHIDSIKNLQPTQIITLIDDIYEVWCRIVKRDRDRGTNFRLKLWQILSWRSIEIAMAGMLARFLDLPHFVVSVKHPTSMLYKLIYETELPPFYLSLPITNVRNESSNRNELDQMRRQVHENLVAFDPLTIDESVPTLFELAGQQDEIEYSPTDPRLRWPFNPEGTLVEGRADIFPFRIPSDEILDVEQFITASVPTRDYRLVDQAKVLAAYRPQYKRSDFSKGMYAEFLHANVSSKEIWVYSPLGVFTSRGWCYRTPISAGTRERNT